MNSVSKRKQMKLSLSSLFICLCIFSLFSNTARFPDIVHEDYISSSVISRAHESSACPLFVTKTDFNSFQPKSSAKASGLFVPVFSSDNKIKIKQINYTRLFVQNISQPLITKFLFHTIQKATLF